MTIHGDPWRSIVIHGVQSDLGSEDRRSTKIVTVSVTGHGLALDGRYRGHKTRDTVDLVDAAGTAWDLDFADDLIM